MSAGIYQIKNDINGKIYVGKAKNLTTRWQQHKSSLAKGEHANKYLQMDYDNMGIDAFTYSILEKVPDSPNLNKILFEKEREWGDKLQAIGEKGYNITNFYQGDKVRFEDAIKLRCNCFDSLRTMTYLCYNFPYECIPLFFNIKERVQYNGVSGLDPNDDGLAITTLAELALIINSTQKDVKNFIKALNDKNIFTIYKNIKNLEQLGFCFEEDKSHFDRNKWIKYF